MTTYEKKNYIIYLKRDYGEPREYYTERGYFIVSQKPKTQKEYDLAVLYSRIYINKKYKKCEYSENIEKKIKEMMKNIFDV